MFRVLLALFALLAVASARQLLQAPTPSFKPTLYASGSTAAENVFAAIIQNATTAAKNAFIINYNPNGSGSGQTDILANATDFAVSDIPLSAAEYAGLNGRALVQLPWSVGLFAVVHSIPGVATGSLQVKACDMAAIYLGTQTTVSVGGTTYTVKPVARSDSSGSTQLFTYWLKSECPSLWTLGSNSTIPWPASVPLAQGSSGIISYVQDNPNSISYVDYGLAFENKVAIAAVLNRAGNYLTPAQTDFTGVANELNNSPTLASIPSSLTADWSKVSFQESALSYAYPISSVEFMMFNLDLTGKGDDGVLLKAFASYVLSPTTQNSLLGFGFAPLPSGVLTLAGSGLTQVKTATPSSSITSITSALPVYVAPAPTSG